MGWSVHVEEVCLLRAACGDCTPWWTGPLRDNEAAVERDVEQHRDWHADFWQRQSEAWERGEGTLPLEEPPTPVE